MITLVRANKTKFGGAENYLSRLSAQLDKNNIPHTIINSNLSKILPSWVRAIVFNLQVCRTKQDNFYFSLERITCADIYRAGDGVHKVFLQIVKKSKLNPLHPVYLYLEKKCFTGAKHIIANSQMVKRQIMQSYEVDESKISVVYNGVNLDNNARPEMIAQEFNLTNEKILLYVGSGFKRKGVEEFLRIVAKLQTQHIKAFVVGKEKKLSSYIALAQQLGIEDKVIFTGVREDVNNFYALSDVFVFPTHYEPFSNVVLEAMSFQTVVFTTKQNGASEILNPECIMESPHADISNQLDALLQDEATLAAMKQENYTIVQDFSIQQNTEHTLKIINEHIY